MKKSLIALALMGAFSGAAVAQSNVTLYGILDVNYSGKRPTLGRHPGPAESGPINSGHQSGNRWGLRGTEALGGGLSAIFTLEGGFNARFRHARPRVAACSVARPGPACPGSAASPWSPVVWPRSRRAPARST